VGAGVGRRPRGQGGRGHGGPRHSQRRMSGLSFARWFILTLAAMMAGGGCDDPGREASNAPSTVRSSAAPRREASNAPITVSSSACSEDSECVLYVPFSCCPRCVQPRPQRAVARQWAEATDAAARSRCDPLPCPQLTCGMPPPQPPCPSRPRATCRKGSCTMAQEVEPCDAGPAASAASTGVASPDRSQ
jgi:hypothetical protein